MNENTLYASDRLFQLMADNILDGLAIIKNKKIIYVNKRLCEITGYSHDELLNISTLEIITHEMRGEIKRDYGDHELHKMFDEKEYEIVRKDGRRRFIYNRHTHLLNGQGNKIIYHFEIITDITERKYAEEKLMTLNQELEDRIEKKTADLNNMNIQLNKEIQERIQAEKALKSRVQELESKKRTIEELNAALRVLLDKRDQDKKELTQNVVYNVKELVLPNVERLMQSSLDQQQREFLIIINSNLKDIISPFGRTLSLSFLKLTPREIYIANLIREGKTTKEIAELMHVSVRTVDSHRDNIRKKLGLKSKKANLRSHLLAIKNT